MVRNTPQRTIKEVDTVIRKYLQAYSKEEYETAADIMSQLIDNFSPYIRKFARLAKSRTSRDISNKDTQQFLTLFLPPNRRRKLDMISAKSFFQAVLEKFEEEEIFNELVALFIDLANRYEPSFGIGFTYYITQYMKWEVSKWVARLTHEPLTGLRTLYEFVDELNPDLTRDMDRELDLPRMTLSWVFECPEGIFSILSNYERYLLYLKYKEEMNSEKIAEKFQKSRQTIMKSINEAIEKVAQLVKKGE
jgi:hypothetical protein